jgi:protein-disulfide isomerase
VPRGKWLNLALARLTKPRQAVAARWETDKLAIMTSSVTFQHGSCRVEVPWGERPAREPRLELERAARFALGCAGLVQPADVEWQAGMLVVTYAHAGELTLAAAASADSSKVGKWLVALADVLAVLHDLGVAHGHLRPELVLVEGSGVRVLGYGVEPVARSVGGDKLAIEALPERYRAPEQRGLSLAAASTWTDTYAFGVIAAELIGEPRLEGRVKELVDAATSSSLVRRPSDLRAFARKLEEALQEGAAPVELPAPPPLVAPPSADAEPPPAPLPAPRVSPPPVSQRVRSSGAWLIALVGGGLLMVVGVGALFVIALGRPSATNGAPAPAATMTGFDAGAPFSVPLPDAAAAPGPSPGAASEGDAQAEVPDLSRAEIETGSGLNASDATAAMPLGPHVPLWGKPGAAATLVVFGDLECPHTRRSLPVLLALKQALGEDLRLAWRHRPLAGNELARGAAEVAAAVHTEHGAAAFWRFIAEAAKDAGSPTDDRLGRWVTAAGGDRARVMAARAGQAAWVERDLLLAGRFDVRATPTAFLNGIRIEGFQALSELRRQTQQEIAAARGTLAAGIESSALYATRVRKNLIGLGPDVAVRSCPELGSSPMRGGSRPLATIVEFSDFECPYCKRIQPALDRVLSRYGGDVRLVWKNLPLASHARARPAATLALEAFDRGGAAKFWNVHDLLFEQGAALDDAGLRAIASKAGLDADAALEIVRRSGHSARIDADVRAAKQLGISGTPTIFINGRKLEGAASFERISAIVLEEIETARRLVANGTSRERIYETVCGGR